MHNKGTYDSFIAMQDVCLIKVTLKYHMTDPRSVGHVISTTRDSRYCGLAYISKTIEDRSL